MNNLDNKRVRTIVIIVIVLSVFSPLFIFSPFAIIPLILICGPLLATNNYKNDIKNLIDQVSLTLNCEYCKCEYKKGVTHCPNCGAPVDSMKSKDVQEAIDKVNKVYEENSKKAKKSLYLGLLILFAPAILLFVFLIFCVLVALAGGM